MVLSEAESQVFRCAKCNSAAQITLGRASTEQVLSGNVALEFCRIP